MTSATSDGGQQWWWCLTHHAVEPDEGCGHKDRLGPYASPELADRALETAAGRTREWDDDDDQWRNPPGP